MPLTSKWRKSLSKGISDVIDYLEQPGQGPEEIESPLQSPLLQEEPEDAPDAPRNFGEEERYMLARVSAHSSATVTTLLDTAISGLPRLHAAAHEGDYETAVLEIVTSNANVNAVHALPNRNNDMVQGVTPLYLAAQAGHYDMCRLLVKRGADVRMKCRVTRTGETFLPADVALTQGNFRIWMMLTKAVKRQKSASDPKLERLMGQ